MTKQETTGWAIIVIVLLLLWWLGNNGLGFLHGENVGVTIGGVAGPTAVTPTPCFGCPPSPSATPVIMGAA